MPGDEINQIKAASGAYTRFALEARKKFITIRERQDPQIKNLYVRLADRVAARVRDTANPLRPARKRHMEQVGRVLQEEADKLNNGLTGILHRDIRDAVEAGAGISAGITFKLLDAGGIKIDDDIRALYFRVNNRAVEAMWRRHIKGLKLSDRIWKEKERARAAIQSILEEAVAAGQDAVETAKLLQQYVRKGALTLARDYPNLMNRMGNRIPGDISYEALRLARSETSQACWQGTIEAGRNSPGYIGARWVLSRSHPLADICDAYADHDEGLGSGVYGPGKEPSYPHPNCLCTIVTVHEQPEEFVEKLKKWKEQGPDPETLRIENWYQRVHGQPSAEVKGLPVFSMMPVYDDAADREIIGRALARLPETHLNMLKAADVRIGTGWTEDFSRYDRLGKMYLLRKGVEIEDVLHETGHAVEDFLQVYQMKEFVKVLGNGIPLEEISLANFVMEEGFQKPFLRLEHPKVKKFISAYQSRLRDEVGLVHQKNGKWLFNPQSLKEYFAEGYREYIDNPVNLRAKDILFYEFIRRLMGDAG